MSSVQCRHSASRDDVTERFVMTSQRNVMTSQCLHHDEFHLLSPRNRNHSALHKFLVFEQFLRRLYVRPAATASPTRPGQHRMRGGLRRGFKPVDTACGSSDLHSDAMLGASCANLASHHSPVVKPPKPFQLLNFVLLVGRIRHGEFPPPPRVKLCCVKRAANVQRHWTN